MTDFQVVYDAFLAKMLDDEWAEWYEDDMQQDWKTLLLGALSWFKFPRVSLDFDDEADSFNEDLDNDVI